MRRQLLVLLGIAVVCAGLAYALSLIGARHGPRSALDAAPAESSLVAHVDVPALRASPLWAAFVAEDDAGLARITEACGFDPIERVQRLAVFVSAGREGTEGRLGFVARGELPAERLVACVQRIVTEDGGGIRRVTIEGVDAIASARGPSRAAFLGRDGVVGGDEAVVRQAILVDRGDAPSAATQTELVRLWRRVEARQEVIAVTRLPSNWRDWLGRLGDGLQLDAIDRVRAVALGARIRSGLGLTLALDAEDAASARDLADAVRARIEDLLGDPMIGRSAAASALRGIELEVREGDVIATLDLDDDELASLVDLVRFTLAQRRDAAVRAQAGGAAGRPEAPDEQLRAGDDTVVPDAPAE